ncbi:hypothetical protein ABZ816_32445 [Actinosynnema sp. NPDC047251]|uniref:hypothetical protein n=1 Tax=Saccharothrix espanaensis TaxID=103731 RepID=UPI00059D4298|nr:hypothetical protein [Saccharothrix espanaensis]
MDTVYQLQARIFHLAYLAEELPEAAQQDVGSWIYRQIAREALAVMSSVTEYIAVDEQIRRVRIGNTPNDPILGASWDESASRGGGVL